MSVKRVMLTCIVISLTSCAYLQYSAVQAEYKKIQTADPSQVNLMHMLDQDVFFLISELITEASRYDDMPLAVSAYSSRFKKNELVNVMFIDGVGTHYGLTLPEGKYVLVVYADFDKDGLFDGTEVVGVKHADISDSYFPHKVAKNVDINLVERKSIAWAEVIKAPAVSNLKRPLYYPAKSIRTLDDDIFDENISTMGMYDPASFLEYAPTMFYALDEDVAYKIPVVFVHGIGGNPRSFVPIINMMDLERYKPWFFYYPSGGDLHQLSNLFYEIFLSGGVIELGDMPIIVVAHSMGGLVVREALNQYQNVDSENKIKLFVSIASPLGGHPSAAIGEEHGMIVLPAWRDLNPESQFIAELYRKPLPSSLNHQLYYAYKNSDGLKYGENSDGVVPLSSQLYATAQHQSTEQFGFNSSHVDILENKAMIGRLLAKMEQVDNVFPESHLRILADGGVNVELTDNYSPEVKHIIGYAGKYLAFLALEKLSRLVIVKRTLWRRLKEMCRQVMILKNLLLDL